MDLKINSLQHIRLTRIIATLGPASSDESVIEQLMSAGVDIFRINFSHGDRSQHLETIRTVRRVSNQIDKNVSILQDLGGPKLRINELQENHVHLLPAGKIRLELDFNNGNDSCIGFTDDGWFSEVRSGERVVLGDGTIHLRIESKDNKGMDCEILSGGALRSRAGLNFPDSDLQLGSMRQKDWEDLKFGLEQEVDAVALSFVQGAEDLVGVRERMKDCAMKPLLIAKIERPSAVHNIDDILEHADGIMVARGDLGISMPLKKIPTIQKQLINKARGRRKFVITATQMLESMTSSYMPTRAEVTDVANAVRDGTDAVMLSGETAIGINPPHVVRTMDEIIVEAESQATFSILPKIDDSVDSAISHVVPILVDEICSRLVITPLTSGATAARISRQRIGVPIFSGVKSDRDARCLRFFHAVYPVVVDPEAELMDSLKEIIEIALSLKLVNLDDYAVVTGGFPLNLQGVTNFMRVVRVGESL